MFYRKCCRATAYFGRKVGHLLVIKVHQDKITVTKSFLCVHFESSFVGCYNTVVNIK